MLVVEEISPSLHKAGPIESNQSYSYVIECMKQSSPSGLCPVNQLQELPFVFLTALSPGVGDILALRSSFCRTFLFPGNRGSRLKLNSASSLLDLIP